MGQVFLSGGAYGFDVMVDEADGEEAFVLGDAWAHEDGLMAAFVPDVGNQDIASFEVGFCRVFGVLCRSLVGLRKQGVRFFPGLLQVGVVMSGINFVGAQGDFIEFTGIIPFEVEVAGESGELVFAFEYAIEACACEQGARDGLRDELTICQFSGDGVAVVAELEWAVDSRVS